MEKNKEVRNLKVGSYYTDISHFGLVVKLIKKNKGTHIFKIIYDKRNLYSEEYEYCTFDAGEVHELTSSGWAKYCPVSKYEI